MKEEDHWLFDRPVESWIIDAATALLLVWLITQL